MAWQASLVAALLAAGSDGLLGRLRAAEWRYETAWMQRAELGFSAPNRLVDPRSGATLGIVANQLDLGVVCFDTGGNRLWHFPLQPRASATPAVGDVNDDGHEEVVAADERGNLVVLDGQGTLLWRAQLAGGVLADSCPAIVDLDGDHAVEILAGDVTGTLTCLDRAGHPRWTFQAADQIGPVLVADIYDAPGSEVLVPSGDGHIYALDASGRWLWDVAVTNDIFPNSTPVLADVDGDGVPELYVGGGLHHFYQIDLRAHQITRVENVHLHVNAAITAADLDGDGKDEVVFGNKGGMICCFGAEGIRWRHTPRQGCTYAGPNVLNVDDDPALEILSHSFASGGLVVLQPDGTVWRSEPAAPTTTVTPLLGDLDRDGATELVIASTAPGALSWIELGLPFASNPSNRLTYSGDRARRGLAAASKPYRPLTTPVVETETAGQRATLSGDLALYGGVNDWRFEVNNPGQLRLALLTEVELPDGTFRRFVRHGRGPHSLATCQVAAFAEGSYVIAQRLVAAESLALHAVRRETLQYAGLASEQNELIDRRSADVAALLARWRTVNPAAADGMARALKRIKAQLAGLGDARIDANQTGRNRIDQLARLRAALARLERLATVGVERAGHGSFVAWPYCPWAYFDEQASLPAVHNRTERLAASLLRGEYESLAVNLTNLLDRRLEVRVRCQDAADSAARVAGQIDLRRAVTVPTVRRRRVADALARLDSAGLISMEPYSSQQLWLTVNAAGLEPGQYVVQLKLESVEPDATEIVLPIDLRVHDLALPRPRPLRFCTWSYDGGWLGTDRPEVLADLVAHGVNVFFAGAPGAECNADGALVGGLDFAQHDEQLKRLAPHGLILFLSPQGALRGQAFLSAPWKAAFAQYLRQWVAHLKDLGLGYGDWALYPYDEPSTPFTETTCNLAEVARLVRAADPNIRIYTDPTSGTTMETMAMLSGLIDIWCPSAELLERLPEMVPVAQRDGREVWFYDAAGRARTLSTLGCYRWRFWNAWNKGLTGVGWWTYATHAPSLWREPNETGEFYSTVYDGPEGPVPSKRWEAARDGVEDYELLCLLRKSVADAAARQVDATIIADAERLLSQLPRQIEDSLRQVGPRLPLTVDGAPAYESALRQLNSARAQIVALCLQLKGQPANSVNEQ